MVAKKGQHQVGKLVSAERGENTTVTMAMSAAGQFLAPFFIFPRQRIHDGLKVGAPAESGFTCNKNGWSTIETFSEWFDHFLSYVRPSAETPVLLIMDGHSSHTKNLEVLEKAKLNHVRIISIPPHTSHKTQPLDVTFMGPFKTHYANALDNYVKRNKGKVVTIYHVAALVNESFTQAATLTIAQNGYRKTGIHPLNRQAFSENDFAPAAFLDRTLDQHTTERGTVRVSSCDQQQLQNLNVDPAATAANVVDMRDLESVTEEIVLDADSTFYFFDENGTITSLVVQESNLSEEKQCETDSPEVLPETPSDPPFGNIQIGNHHSPTRIPSKKVRHTTYCYNSMDNDENLSPAEIAAPSIPKRRRWDKGFSKSQNKSITFNILPQMVDLNPTNAQEQIERKRNTGNKKQQSAELTSSPYRQRLKEAQASKDIKNIKKKPVRKRKAKANDKPEDILCPTCGACFSASANGTGWKKCVACSEWFHAECQDSNDDLMTCSLCI